MWPLRYCSGHFFGDAMKIVIDEDALKRYEQHYFALHPRARNKPIKQPRHESINQWMILKRPAMNALKQRWKDFIIWLANDLGIAGSQINKCEITHTVYFSTNQRHDSDNTVPKFILDGLVESGVIIDDDSKHITKLTLQCGVDKENPRTEIIIDIINE